MELTLGSLFDGIAGFPLSASCYGIVTKWASEIEAFPIKVTQEHFPNMVHLGDVTQINGAEIAPVDIISFGSPCQDMSVAGKRAGLEGERSGLFVEAVRIIKEMRNATYGIYPKFAIWENVPGAFSSNGGADFRAVLEEITEAEIPVPKSGRWAEAGMVGGNGRSVAWRVLDAQYWGVPQRRKRIFLVADFRGECAGEILFEREGLSGNIEESGEAWEEVAGSVGDGVETTSRINCEPGGISGTVSSKWAKGTGGQAGDEHYNLITIATKQLSQNIGHNVAMPLMESDYKEPQVVLVPLMVENHPADSRVKIDDTGTTQTLTSRMGTGGGNVPMLMQPTYAIQSGTMPNKSQNGLGVSREIMYTLDTRVDHAVTCAIDVRNLNETEELSGTLQSKNTGGYSLNYQNPVRIGYRVRRLTPTECLRLMGFPDNWLDIEKASDSAKYKAVGNSVAIPCVEFIFSQIVKVLRKEQPI